VFNSISHEFRTRTPKGALWINAIRSVHVNALLTDSGQTVLSLDSRKRTIELAKELDLPEDKLMLAIFALEVMQRAAEEVALMLTFAAVAAAAS
jgi:hypothetical protein